MKPILKMKNWQLFRVRGYEGSVDLRDQSFVAIGKRALMGRNNPYLEQVYIPAGASVIKAEAFLGCKNLQTVILSTANNIGFSAGVFRNCHRLHTVANAEKIHSIGANCFANCNTLCEICLGNDLSRIGEGAFNGCQSLTSIALPSSLRSVGKGAFGECTALTFCQMDEGLSTLGEEMLRGCVSLREVKIPAAVTSIPKRAFKDCISLREVTIPANVQIVEAGAFENCRKLHTIKMELGVKEIGAHAFDHTPALREVFVPHSVKKLGYAAFGKGKRKDGEMITVCVENEYMVRRMKRLLFWCGSANCTTVKLIGKTVEERKRERRRESLDAKGTHLIG